MEAASQYPFLVYLRLASYWAFQAQQMQSLSLPSQRLYRDTLSCLVIEEAMATTTGCANGLCENTATKINTSGAKRSALPACRISTISSEQCNATLLTELDPSELDPSWSTIRKLSSGVIPANVEPLIPHFVHRSLCARPPKPHG